MKNKILFSGAILIILILLVNNLIGNTRIIYDSKWIVPASVIGNDTIPMVNFPAVVIVGSI